MNGGTEAPNAVAAGMSAGELVLFVAGGLITVVLLVATIVFWVMLHREERRAAAERGREPEA